EDSAVHYVTRLVFYHAFACRGGLLALWHSDGSESWPVWPSAGRDRVVGGLAVAKAFGGKTGFANAVEGAAGGTPSGICHLSFMPGLPSGSIHIVASFLSSHHDSACFPRSGAGQF